MEKYFTKVEKLKKNPKAVNHFHGVRGLEFFPSYLL